MYIAPVAKSTIVPGKNNRISAIKAKTLTSLCGSPGRGFVFWCIETGPPRIVAQPVIDIAKKQIRVLLNIFFIMGI